MCVLNRTHSILLALVLLPAGVLLADVSAQETPAGGAPIAAASGMAWVDSYDALLQKYVTAEGVRYKAWHASASDTAELGKVIGAISGQSLAGMAREERLAFYLNAYNAWILHRILEEYPTDGPGGGGFFGRNSFFKSDDLRVAGVVTSFDDLENAVIRPQFREPRIHFALNCASRSCPPLHGRAIRAETLDATLDVLTRAFVNSNASGVRVEGGGRKVEISRIFDWYADDFSGGAVVYINRYREAKIPDGARVEFQDYSWKLNEAR